jgi:hypothetical protein
MIYWISLFALFRSRYIQHAPALWKQISLINRVIANLRYEKTRKRRNDYTQLADPRLRNTAVIFRICGFCHLFKQAGKDADRLRRQMVVIKLFKVLFFAMETKYSSTWYGAFSVVDRGDSWKGWPSRLRVGRSLRHKASSFLLGMLFML